MGGVARSNGPPCEDLLRRGPRGESDVDVSRKRMVASTPLSDFGGVGGCTEKARMVSETGSIGPGRALRLTGVNIRASVEEAVLLQRLYCSAQPSHGDGVFRVPCESARRDGRRV